MKKKNFEFEKKGIILFSMMMIANICSYLFQIVLARFLSIENFAIVSSLLALSAIFAIPDSIITIIVAKYVSFTGKENIQLIICILKNAIAIIASVLIVSGILCGGYLQKKFEYENVFYVYLSCLVAVISLLYFAINGILQGLQDFFAMGMQGIIMIVSKLLFSILFLTVTPNVMGPLFATLLGTIIAIIYGSYKLKDYNVTLVTKNEPIKIERLSIVKTISFTVLLQGIYSVYMNGDLLISKVYFDDLDVGMYSTISVLSKIITYVSSALVGVMLPIASAQKREGNSTKKILLKCLGYVMITTIILSFIFIWKGLVLVSALFGEKYIEGIEYFPIACYFSNALSVSSIIINYSVAIDDVNAYAFAVTFSFIACLIILVKFHLTIIITIGMWGSSLWIANIIGIFILLVRKNECIGSN